MPEPNTMLFGGVAAGSMNAQLAASAVGMMIASGSIAMPPAMAANTGTSVAVLARLLVSSVRKVIRTTANTTTSTGGTL